MFRKHAEAILEDINGMSAENQKRIVQANLRAACNAGLERAAEMADERWNCNCLTDESLGRDVCECSGNVANAIRDELAAPVDVSPTGESDE
jgi:hypothetical protein